MLFWMRDKVYNFAHILIFSSRSYLHHYGESILNGEKSQLVRLAPK